MQISASFPVWFKLAQACAINPCLLKKTLRDACGDVGVISRPEYSMLLFTITWGGLLLIPSDLNLRDEKTDSILSAHSLAPEYAFSQGR